MSQISTKLAKVIKSSFHRKFCHEPGESVSSIWPSRGVGDSARTIEGQRITNIATGTFTLLIGQASEKRFFSGRRRSRPSSRGSRASYLGRNLRTPSKNVFSLALTALSLACVPMLFTTSDTSAITVSIDNPNLTLNLPTKSSTGDFVESSPATITVNSDSGYTLSIASSSDNTDLTSGSNKITSISSSLSKTDFSATNNTDYNNKWGYKPSQYVTVDGEDNKTVVDNTGDNSVFKPLPTSTGEILDYKDSSSGDNTYTLSIGARASINTPLGEYQSDTFVIAAVGNVATDNLIINYDANGGYFGSDTSKTTNSVEYDAITEKATITKYSHTSNISDAGVQDGTYSGNLATKDVVTIPGASSLHVKITYGTENNWDMLYVFQGQYTGDISRNMDQASTGWLYKYMGGNNTTTTVDIDITGDTATFGFYSDGSSNYYGYYVIITGEGAEYSKTVTSGTYATPTLPTTGYYEEFLGWSTDKDATTPTYTTEAEISSSLQAINGDAPVTLYAVWKEYNCTRTISGITYMQDITSSNKTTVLAAMDVDKQYSLKDKRDEKPYCVAKLQDGNIWMTQNLDLDLDSTKELKHADTDLGWGTDTTTTTWTPTRSTIDATGGTISNWTNDNNTPYSVDVGDWYWMGNPFYSSANCNYLTGCTTKFTKTPSYDTYGAHGHVGNYYNWSAAVASNSTSSYSSSTISDISGNPQNSICPAGWRLPTISNASNSTAGSTSEFSRLNYLYNGNVTNTSQKLEASPLFLVRAGYVSGVLLYSAGYCAYYWSSTVNSGTNAYYLYFVSTNVSPVNYADRNSGRSVRCLVR